MFIEDDKLPDDVVRKRYSETRHALCCLECGYETDFDPTVQGSIGRLLYVLLEHNCPEASGRLFSEPKAPGGGFTSETFTNPLLRCKNIEGEGELIRGEPFLALIPTVCLVHNVS
jgi:hypothetical protein